jgi:hypothetical protein
LGVNVFLGRGGGAVSCYEECREKFLSATINPLDRMSVGVTPTTLVKVRPF